MILLPIQKVSNESWQKLIAKWGLGKAQPRYIYKIDCTVEKLPNHQVLHGPSPAGDYTNSGFLFDHAGNVVGGVDAIKASVT